MVCLCLENAALDIENYLVFLADAGSFDNAVRLYDIRQGKVGRKGGAHTEHWQQ